MNKKNYYGSLCTEMYEILHKKAPKDELDFYLSYAEKGKKILGPLCGSGCFLVPMFEQGFNICGMDLSNEMLNKLKQKSPNANVVKSDILEYLSKNKFDYIFISSGSMSLFTDIVMCKKVLEKMKEILTNNGKFVFALDTIANRCPDDYEYKVAISVKTNEGFDLILKSKNYYDEINQTQFSPSIYELKNGENLLQSETMDFQIHLYKFGEMDDYLREIGFNNIIAYSSFTKKVATKNLSDMLLYECTL